MSEFKRARDPKQKEQRRNEILASATRLYQDTPSALPTTAAIGKDSGVAKGTLYLYFRSKEEIFLAILQDFHLRWLALFRDHNYSSLDDIPALLQSCWQFMQENPLFLQLASMSNSVIEHNVDAKILMAHKNELSKALMDAASSIQTLVQHIDEQEIAQLLMRTYASLLGLWQISHPPAKIAKVIQSQSLKNLQPEFGQQAEIALHQLWHGALHANKAEKTGIWRKLFS